PRAACALEYTPSVTDRACTAYAVSESDPAGASAHDATPNAQRIATGPNGIGRIIDPPSSLQAAILYERGDRDYSGVFGDPGFNAGNPATLSDGRESSPHAQCPGT